MALAVGRWPEFHGTVLMRGCDPLRLPLPSLLDVIHAWWVEGATEEDAAKFRQQLEMPPAGADLEARDDWSDDAAEDAFARAMAAR